MCHIQREREASGAPTLGIFKPGEIRRLTITATTPNWTAQQLVHLQQVPLLQRGPRQLLEKLPFDFRYEFRCDDQSCTGHQMLCTDWEMGQAYRAWQRQYRAQWEGVFRHRFEYEMIHKFDTHFFVGNIHQHPASWIIVGLFYPPRPAPSPAMGDLFD